MVAGSHTDAVLGLSWNREHQHVLASGSADTTIKVWDVTTQSCQVTIDWHSDKVQAVAWNPADAPVLLSAAFDKIVRLVSIVIFLSFSVYKDFDMSCSTTSFSLFSISFFYWKQ